MTSETLVLLQAIQDCSEQPGQSYVQLLQKLLWIDEGLQLLVTPCSKLGNPTSTSMNGVAQHIACSAALHMLQLMARLTAVAD